MEEFGRRERTNHLLAVRFGGPILNRFRLDTAAKALYPERFGDQPAYDGGVRPEISDGEHCSAASGAQT